MLCRLCIGFMLQQLLAGAFFVYEAQVLAPKLAPLDVHCNELCEIYQRRGRAIYLKLKASRILTGSLVS